MKTLTMAMAAIGLILAPAAVVSAKPIDAKPGTVFSECKDCPQMVVVPPGRFVMGAAPGEKGGAAEARHPVTIAWPFAVGRFEVTFDEWAACLKDGGCAGVKLNDEGWGRGKRPVVDVDWDNAKAYVAWLSRKAGHPYRLLSEAEWEYAARAGSTTAFSFGPTLSAAQANFDASSKTELNPAGAHRGKTLPVGSFPANAFGLHDMHGNVFEWVEDCWHDDYKGAPADGRPWLGDAAACGGRVLRGGSWEDSATELRAAARVGGAVTDRSADDGFRVARDLP